MGTWNPVCAKDDLEAGAMMAFEIGDRQIAVYNIDGGYFATDNICTHGYALLTDGFLDGDQVECGLHGGCFDVRTGKALCEPVEVDLKTYPVRLEQDRLEVYIDQEP